MLSKIWIWSEVSMDDSIETFWFWQLPIVLFISVYFVGNIHSIIPFPLCDWKLCKEERNLWVKRDSLRSLCFTFDLAFNQISGYTWILRASKPLCTHNNVFIHTFSTGHNSVFLLDTFYKWWHLSDLCQDKQSGIKMMFILQTYIIFIGWQLFFKHTQKYHSQFFLLLCVSLQFLPR